MLQYITILLTLTVHWFIYNALLILLTKETEKKQKKHIYIYIPGFMKT